MILNRGRWVGGKAALALLGLALGMAVASAAFYQASRPVTASVSLIAPVPGDANLDFRVDRADLALAARHLRLSPLPPTAPDLNRDGVMDILDLVLMGRNYAKEVRR